MSKIVAVQGQEGSFHQLAANKYFKKQAKSLLFCQTFIEVFEALTSGKADCAVIAISNNRYGDIDQVYDILIDSTATNSNRQYWISGEVYVNIKQSLLGFKGTDLEKVQEVHSQAPAIVQCLSFIKAKLPNATVVEQEDTAQSAQKVAKWQDSTKVAIAHKNCAKLYGLTILAENVQDDSNNLTRFLVIEPDLTKIDARASRTSLIIKTNHEVGALAKVINIFAEQGINLSYLQSSPIPNRPFEYIFNIDIDEGLQKKAVKLALANLSRLGYDYKILGSYRQAEIPKN